MVRDTMRMIGHHNEDQEEEEDMEEEEEIGELLD